MSNLLNVSYSPHTRSQHTTSEIMFDVAIALMPAVFFGVYRFGFRALAVIMVSVISAVLSEYIWQNLMRKPVTVNDGSAVVTGLLLALNLPASVPLWIPLMGSAFAIIIVKQLFGGIGQNFMNPALAARCFLVISFSKIMTTYSLDSVSGATPLQQLKDGAEVRVSDMFLGNIDGVIGEVSVIAILIGAAYLLIKKVISPKIPLIYIGSFAVLVLLFGGRGFDLHYLAAHLCGGGLMLGAFFMATDYSSSPVTNWGRIIFALLLGFLTAVFRIFGSTAEGVSYAIIIGNILVPLIEKITVPKPFGRERAGVEG